MGRGGGGGKGSGGGGRTGGGGGRVSRTREAGGGSAGGGGGGGVKVEDLDMEDKVIVADYIGGMGEQEFAELTDAIPEDINMWGGGGVNEYINIEQSFNNLSKAEQASLLKYADKLEGALNKVEDWEGTAYRVIDETFASGYNNMEIQTATKMGPLTANYTPGSVVNMKGFTSASRSTDAELFSYKNTVGAQNTRIKIIAKHGKSVENVAGFYKTQYEILFNRNANFKVMSREWNPKQQTWDVTMAEL
jgi:hypothetical protein